MTGIWHLDLDLNMVTGFLYIHGPNFSLFLGFEGSNFGGRWDFLTGVWHFDFDLDIVTGV